MIKIGCQTVAFAPRLPDSLYEVLEKIAAMGYMGVEVGARFIKEPQKFTKTIERLGLEIAGVHTGANLFDGKAFEQSQASFEGVARFAEKLGCPRIILSGAGPKNGKLSDEELAVQADNLNQLGDVARKHGAKVYYHNHALEFQDNERVIQSIVADTDGDIVGLAVDLGWAEYAGSDPVKTIEKYKDRIGHLHIRDLRDGKFFELGNGRTDVRKIVGYLQEIGYAGWLMVEMELHAPDYGGQLSPGESVAIGYGYLKALL